MVTNKIQDSVEITRWDRKYRSDFIRLNREWIERFFCLEESDLKILGDPEGEIIDEGGEIFLALSRGKVVGCCALVHHPDTGRYELAKMTVSPAEQGKGIGYLFRSRPVEICRGTWCDRYFSGGKYTAGGFRQAVPQTRLPSGGSEEPRIRQMQSVYGKDSRTLRFARCNSCHCPDHPDVSQRRTDDRHRSQTYCDRQGETTSFNYTIPH